VAVSSVRPKGIRLRTSFVSEAAFVSAFHALSDESSLFVPTDKLYPAGTSCYFSLELADESPMLRGLGIVIDSWSGADNAFKKPGIHVRITQLTAQSEPIFERLLAARPAALRKDGPRTRKAPMTQQHWGKVVAPPTTEMDTQFPDDEETAANADAESTVNARPITREMRSASLEAATLASPPRAKTPTNSAAPVAELDEKTTETQRYDTYLRLPASPALPPPPSRPTPPPRVAPPSRLSTVPGAPPELATGSTPPESSTSTPARGSAPALPGIPPVPSRASDAAATRAPLPAPNTAATRAPLPAPKSEATPSGIALPALSAALAPTSSADLPPGPTDAPRGSGDFFTADEAQPLPEAAWATGVDAPPSPWWKLPYWRSGAWRSSAWATWCATHWRRYVRDGKWRTAWWANRRTAAVLGVGIVVGVLFTLLLRPSHSSEAPPPAKVAAIEPPSCPPAPPPAIAATEPAPPPAKHAPAKPSAKPAAKPAAPAPKPKAIATTKPETAAAAPAPKPKATAPAPKPAAPAVAQKSPAAKPTPPPSKPAKGNPCKASVPCI